MKTVALIKLSQAFVYKIKDNSSNSVLVWLTTWNELQWPVTILNSHPLSPHSNFHMLGLQKHSDLQEPSDFRDSHVLFSQQTREIFLSIWWDVRASKKTISKKHFPPVRADPPLYLLSLLPLQKLLPLFYTCDKKTKQS